MIQKALYLTRKRFHLHTEQVSQGITENRQIISITYSRLPQATNFLFCLQHYLKGINYVPCSSRKYCQTTYRNIFFKKVVRVRIKIQSPVAALLIAFSSLFYFSSISHCARIDSYSTPPPPPSRLLVFFWSRTAVHYPNV